MVKVKLIPKGVELDINGGELTLKEIIEVLRSELTGSDIMVIVNDRVADSWDLRVKSSDRVVVVEEFLGG
ncbi:MAG: hypothetical protein OWQ48_04920 [Desulfurococcus sp.]|nr:hypothetical protein [Desulfurococcus sp.]